MKIHALKSGAMVFLAVAWTTLAFAQEAGPAKKLNVIASNEILADMTRQIGGDRVRVSSLVPPGGDLHGFEPTPAQVKAVAQADMVVVNGLGLEAWIDKLVQNSGFKGRVVTASDGVKALAAEHDHEHEHGKHTDDGHDETLDPHAWMSVANGIRYVQNIRDGLCGADAAGAEDYRAWEGVYETQLRVLDSWIQQEAARVPRERRVLIIDHNAFQYFGAAYGFDVVSLSGSHRLQEPSAADVAKLVELMRERGVKEIFFESTANEKALRQLAGESGAALGGNLITDGVSSDGIALSYIQIHMINVRRLVRALR